mgnify:CR=1 FL=1
MEKCCFDIYICRVYTSEIAIGIIEDIDFIYTVVINNYFRSEMVIYQESQCYGNYIIITLTCR